MLRGLRKRSTRGQRVVQSQLCEPRRALAGDEEDGKGGTVDMLKKKKKQDFKLRGKMRKSKSPKPSNIYKKWTGVRTFTPPSAIQLLMRPTLGFSIA